MPHSRSNTRQIPPTSIKQPSQEEASISRQPHPYGMGDIIISRNAEGEVISVRRDFG